MDIQFITQQTLEAANIDLTGEDVTALLVHLNEELQDRIGTEITDSLSDEQVKTMNDMQDTATEQEMTAWIHQNVPDMEAIIQDEIDLLLSEIVETDEEDE